MMLKLYTTGQILWSEGVALAQATELRMRRAAQNERGASAIEYALLVALVALVIVAGLTFLGNRVNNKLNGVGGNTNLNP